MSAASCAGQDEARSPAELFEATLHVEPRERADGLVGSSNTGQDWYTGLALVDSVNPNFGTAMFYISGKKQQFFFFKNKVFIGGQKVSSKVSLEDVLESNKTVVAFEVVRSNFVNYDVNFKGLKVCVLKDIELPALPDLRDLSVDKSMSDQVTKIQNQCASIKHVSLDGGVLDYTPEVQFHKSVVHIPEFVDGTKSLPVLIPKGTLVNFDAVVKGTSIEVTSLWVENNIKQIPSNDLAHDQTSFVIFKGWSARVVCYTSANEGVLGGFKVLGDVMSAVFSREVVYFPESSNMTLEQYIPKGTTVHFDGKLRVYGNISDVEVCFLWLGKRPVLKNETRLGEHSLDGYCSESASSEAASVRSVGTEVGSTARAGDRLMQALVAKEVLVGRCGIVKCYKSSSEGVIQCLIGNVQQAVLFREGSVCLEPQLRNKKLSESLPVNTRVNFDAEVKSLYDGLQYVATVIWINKKPKLSEIGAESTGTHGSNTGLCITTGGILHNRAAKVKYFVSDTEGVVEFSVNGVIKEALFRKDVVIMPEGNAVPLEDYLTIGRAVFFDGQAGGESDTVIITSLWAEKRKKSQPLCVAPEKPGANMPDILKEKEVDDGSSSHGCLSSDSDMEHASVYSSSEELELEEAATPCIEDQVPCLTSSSIKGQTGTILSYTSKSSGIIQCTISKSKVNVAFHKEAVYIPDKAKNLTLEEYLPVDKSIYFDGEVIWSNDSESTSPVVIVTLVWVGKKPRQHVSESRVRLIDTSDRLLQREIYEAEVVQVEHLFFVACVSSRGSRIPVFVWNQFFRPTPTSEEFLKKGESVNCYVSVGDRVFLRPIKNYGENKDDYEWCTCDCWKGTDEARTDRIHVAGTHLVSPAARQDKADGEGAVVHLEKESAFLRDRVSGVEVTFHRRNAFLFGVMLAGIDLTQVLAEGDLLFYVMANDVETAKVWLGSPSVEGVSETFVNVTRYCQERSIPMDVKKALVVQLCAQKSLGGPSGTDAPRTPGVLNQQQSDEEAEDTSNEDELLIYDSDSVSMTDDSGDEGTSSNNDKSLNHLETEGCSSEGEPMTRDWPMGLPTVDSNNTEDKSLRSQAVDSDNTEDKSLRSQAVDSDNTEDKSLRSQAVDSDKTEDKSLRSQAVDSDNTEDKSLRSQAVDSDKTEDKSLRSQAVDSDNTEDKSLRSQVVDSDNTEDKSLRSQAVDSDKTEDKSLRSQAVYSDKTEDKSLRSQAVDSNNTEDKYLRSQAVDSNNTEDKSLRSQAVDSNNTEDKSLRSQAVDSNNTEDKSLRSQAVDSNNTEDKSLRSQAVDSNKTGDESMKFLAVDSNKTEDKSLRSQAVDSNNTEDKSLRSQAVDSNNTEDKSLRSQAVDSNKTGDESMKFLAVDSNKTGDESMKFLAVTENKATRPLTVDLCTTEDKSFRPTTVAEAENKRLTSLDFNETGNKTPKLVAADLNRNEYKPVRSKALDFSKIKEGHTRYPTVDFNNSEVEHMRSPADFNVSGDDSRMSPAMDSKHTKDKLTSSPAIKFTETGGDQAMRPQAVDFNKTVDEATSALTVDVLPFENRHSLQGEAMPTSNTEWAVEDIHSLEHSRSLGPTWDATQPGACLAFNETFSHVLQSSLETVLRSKEIELGSSHEVAAEVMALVCSKTASGKDVSRGDCLSQNQPSSPASPVNRRVHWSVCDGATNHAESSTQTISTGHIISLRYLP